MSKGIPWRVQSTPDGNFDELVVGGNGGACIIHVEAMSPNHRWFVSVGDRMFWVESRGGKINVVEEDT